MQKGVCPLTRRLFQQILGPIEDAPEPHGGTPMTPSPADHAQLEALVIQEVERRVGDLRKELKEELDALRERTVGNRATIVVFSGDLDRVMAALVIATGAASMGMEVSMFFTFWGLSVLKKERQLGGKNVLEKAFSVMTPAGIGGLGVSKMNFAGAGALMLRKMMKDKDVASVEELFAMAREMNVRLVACTMSMDVMGVKESELIDNLEFGGVATYLGDASDSKVTLFI
jgi:peroxiredoxin family protein